MPSKYEKVMGTSLLTHSSESRSNPPKIRCRIQLKAITRSTLPARIRAETTIRIINEGGTDLKKKVQKIMVAAFAPGLATDPNNVAIAGTTIKHQVARTDKADLSKTTSDAERRKQRDSSDPAAPKIKYSLEDLTTN